VIATWDDHEVGNNWSPETIDPELLARATQAFFEHLPIRRDEASPGRIWRKLRFGRTAEIFVLDGRSERRPSTRETDGATYLSREQMDWLKGGLAASEAVFKIVMNSVPIGNFPASFDLGSILLDPADRWQGYPAARRELLSFIEDTPIPGVVFLSGDFHLACAGRAAPSGVGSRTLEILAGPGAQVANPLSYLLDEPQFDYATHSLNYATLALDPATRQIRVSYVGSSGSVLRELVYTL
jgi:alkaline phosphatase D